MVNLWGPVREFMAMISWVTGLTSILELLLVVSAQMYQPEMLAGSLVAFWVSEAVADVLHSELMSCLRGVVKAIEHCINRILGLFRF